MNTGMSLAIGQMVDFLTIYLFVHVMALLIGVVSTSKSSLFVVKEN